MELSPVFWDTQGDIKYNINKSFFNYETSMNINWNNKIARKVLINLIQLFNIPEMLYLEPNGLGIWTKKKLDGLLYYKKPLLFNEINIRDFYVLDTNKQFIREYPFLNINYEYKIDSTILKKIYILSDYFSYDSFRNMISIKSRTIDENILMLDILLHSPINSLKGFKKTLENKIKKINKSGIILEKNMKDIIINLNNKLVKFTSNKLMDDETNFVKKGVMNDITDKKYVLIDDQTLISNNLSKDVTSEISSDIDIDLSSE